MLDPDTALGSSFAATVLQDKTANTKWWYRTRKFGLKLTLDSLPKPPSFLQAVLLYCCLLYCCLLSAVTLSAATIKSLTPRKAFTRGEKSYYQCLRISHSFTLSFSGLKMESNIYFLAANVSARCWQVAIVSALCNILGNSRQEV